MVVKGSGVRLRLEQLLYLAVKLTVLGSFVLDSDRMEACIGPTRRVGGVSYVKKEVR